MSTNIAASHLQREEVSIAYKMMLCPAMKYSLSCTTLSHSECDMVDRSYLPTLLSRMGINKCTKRLLLFGPPSLGALGFTNTWTDQGIAQVQLLLGHLRQGQEIGQLLQVLMETLQMVIGSSLPLFHYPIQQILKFCHRNWLLNVWEFLLSIQGKIHLENAWILAPQRRHDVFLMDAVLEHTPSFPPKILKCFNACRIFLQVFTLADICDGSGRDILKCSIQGTRHKDRRSSYEWPKQIRPSPAAWCIWRNTLQSLFCVTTKGTRLRQPLGAWICGAPSHQHWTYFFHPGTRSLIYSVEASGMFCRFHQARQSPRIFHSTSDIIFSRPSQMIPVTVAQVTAQFLELSGCPITSHINGHTNQTSPIGIHTAPTIS